MATFNWPGFGIESISWTFDQPSQDNTSAWTGTSTIISDPWHGKNTVTVTLAKQQGDGAFQAARAFFTGLKGQINTFHLPAVEAPQNANTGVTLSANAAQGAASIALTGVTTALVPGNMVTIAGQLLLLTTVGTLSGTAQTINFEPTLRAAALSGASVETARPYLLARLATSKFSWDIGQWRRYGLSFDATEAVGETDGAAPSGDTWNATFSGSGGGSPVYSGVAVQKNGGTLSQATALNLVGASLIVAGSTASISLGVTPQQFAATSGLGPLGGGTQDDSPAFLAAIAYLKTNRTLPNSGYGSGSAELFVPAGTYFLGTTTVDLTHTMRFRGESGGGGGGATVLEWTAGTTGIRVQSFNTTGATAVITPTPTDITAGQGTIIEGLLLKGNYAGTESEAHGIHLRGAATIRDCGIYDFAGDGINVHATAGSGAPNEGNDNNSRFENLLIQNCRNGLFIDGADVNACKASSIDFINNRGFGLWDSSFLGNTHDAHQTAGNGAVAGTHPPCWVSQGGNRYVVKRGQETGASTNAPSGTTADNTWWYYYGAGAPDSTIRCPAWVSGTTYRAGGAYCTDDVGSAGNVFTGCYIEGSQPFAQFVTPTLVVGGSMDPNVKGVPCLIADSSNIKSTNGLAALGSLTILGNLNAMGPQSGSAVDTIFQCNSTNSFQLNFNRYNSVGTLLATDGSIIGAVNGLQYKATNFHQFYVAGSRVFYCDNGGLKLDAGMTIQVNAVQVVGARQTGTPADATDLATALTLVNALKAKLVAHGLIS